jgi:DNA processing protein
MASTRTYRITDRDYPLCLRDLARPPDPLVVRGDWEGRPAVAIVGSRRASPDAVAYAQSLAFRLSQAGAIVWSGGAVGIDAAAHQGALDAAGRTVVVTATGIDHVYPEKHRKLYETIVEGGGALVSSFVPSQTAVYWTFLSRNRVLAAMVDALVVVQSPLISGARSAAAAARRCGRPVFVVPAYPWDWRGLGNLAEMRRGAHPLADEAVLAQHLSIRLAPRQQPPADQGGLAPAEGDVCVDPASRAVLDATDESPRHFDEISDKTGLSVTVLSEALLTLTLGAVLVEGPSGFYRRVRS